MEWWYLGGGAAAGLLLGVLIGRFISAAPRKELQQARAELDAYRTRVSQHFARTAELVEVLAANSREIYQHLARGSQDLCAADAVRLKNDALLMPLPDSQREPAVARREEPLAVNDAEVTVVANQAGRPKAEAAPAGGGKPEGEWSEVLPEIDAYHGRARFN